MKHCRGQERNNEANMKGKNSGTQKRILDQNPLAFLMPCGYHSLNLVLCDAAKSSVKSVTLFGVLGRLYSLFVAPVNHWEILTDQVKSFTLEQLSDMCWEAKIASVKALRYQIGNIHDALITLAKNEEGHDPDIAHEATTLFHQLTDFSSLVSLVIWYDVLFKISVVSKSMRVKSLMCAS
jgi:hypothetical protein